MCALWGSAARGSSCSEREGAEEGTALANLVVPRDVFHIPPPTERPRGAQARARSWTSQGGVCAEGPPATKKDRARAARRPLAPLRRPHAPPACHARPKRPAAGGPSAHRTVRRTWRSTRRPRRRGPARRARPREVGSRRRGRERRRVPRAAAGRVLHTMCPTQRRNQRLADEPFRALGRAEPRAKGGERDAPHPRPPAERTGPARAPRSAAEIPPIQTLYRWALFRAFSQLTHVPLPMAAVCAAAEHGTALTRGPRVLGSREVALPQLRRRLERGRRADAPPPPRLPAPAAAGKLETTACSVQHRTDRK